ncbi:hypothetical protein [Streptomyces solicathayae]|uniref:Uncharacterized protein n=1 Tax=Streptomyces solicathayae TaxID=3081768 RepID=A0ABZ0LTF7_9ACTN|nr:hypothetical protein [Streptomyces sp. HUAS YS2]WOX22657.1 hypothetical protein R2D22_15115 [Streptomyces sp. HUAS YS2]
MSFGGPQWPQQPQNQQQPFGGQPPFGSPQPPSQPQQPFGSGGQTPDWGALADASAARARRKRWIMIGGGALATLVVGAIVATAVVAGGDDPVANGKNDGPTTPASPTDSPEPQPSFSSVAPPPPPNPKDFISNEAKDKAPISPDSLFPGKKLTMSGRAYQKGATASTTNCASVGQAGLGEILKRNGCDRVIRATYVKDGVAITVGVAIFSTEAEALKAKAQAKGGIAPLAGAGVKEFCRSTVCLRRANAVGRYAYFTQAGFTNGKKVTMKDTPIFKASDDLGNFTFNQIYARGRQQASAAATAPAGQ